MKHTKNWNSFNENNYPTLRNNKVVLDGGDIRTAGSQSELSYSDFIPALEGVFKTSPTEKIVQIEFTQYGIRATFERK